MRARGDVTVWVSDEAIASWTPEPTGRRGGQSRYSSLAILTALTLRLVFRLPLRQTEGFVGSLLRLMGLELNAPDHTTLSRRGRDVEVPPLRRDHDGPIHLVVDSTGLKVFGAGEWSTRKHGKRKLRRGWRKLHIGVDGSDFIVAGELTKSDIDDASMVPKLLESIDVKLRRFTGDGAYDQRLVYNSVARAGTEDVKVVVPPRKDATPNKRAKGAWLQRNAHLKQINEIGRQAWQKESGYRQQARAENTFFRWKWTLGDRLRAKHFKTQQREAMIGCGVLNRMFELGKPESYAVKS
ncbi:MAG: IS5 family transposase [Deltaproteobacteria bacterium]|nr:IS5 family transposase [Deltaproteobacteria bacterium]